jgi:hypothetical protein
MIGVLAFAVIGWITGGSLQVDVVVGIIALLAAIVVGNFDRRSLQGLDWNFLLFNGVALSISGVTRALGLDSLVAEAVGGPIGHLGSNPALFLLAVSGLNLLGRLVLGQNQAILLFGLALSPIAPAVGMEPWVVIVAILATNVVWFLPQQTNSYLTAYSASEGRLFSHGQARQAAVGYTLVTLIALILVLPYWHLLGLL